MAANIYGRVDHFTKGLNVMRRQQDLGDVEAIVRELRVASRFVDNLCQGSFAAVTDTRRFDGGDRDRTIGSYSVATGRRLLRLPAPHALISVTSVACDFDGDGTFDTALSPSDYFLIPANDPPYTMLEVRSRQSTIVAWPPYRNSVQIAGVYGWSNEADETGRVLAGAIDADDTTLTLDGNSDIQQGETLPIEDEQVYVARVLTPTTYTMERGVNGTTAAAHADETPVSRRVYPFPVTEAVYFYAARSLRGLSSGGTNPGASQFAPNPSGNTGERGVRKALEHYMRFVIG